MKFRPFAEARKFARSLGFTNRREYEKWAKSGQRPNDIPSHADDVYRNEGWVSWPDFLGYGKNCLSKYGVSAF